jgi:hypothetical protein
LVLPAIRALVMVIAKRQADSAPWHRPSGYRLRELGTADRRRVGIIGGRKSSDSPDET